MSKRYTATEKWDDAWFHSLTKDEKLLWIWLLDKCNHAGIWDVNFAVMEFYLPGLIWDHSKFTGRVVPVAGGTKWFIPKFIVYQYVGPGELNPDNRVHQSVIAALKKEGLWPLPRKKEKTPLPLSLPVSPLLAPSPIGSPIQAPSAPSPIEGAKDKDQDKDNDKDKVLVKDKDKATDNSRAHEYYAPASITCEYCGPILNHANHKKCHYCFHVYDRRKGEHDDNHRCPRS